MEWKNFEIRRKNYFQHRNRSRSIQNAFYSMNELCPRVGISFSEIHQTLIFGNHLLLNV